MVISSPILASGPDTIFHRLSARVRAIETAGRQHGGSKKTISSGCPDLDSSLPGGGYSPGTLIEWLEPVRKSPINNHRGSQVSGTVSGTGASYLALATAAEAITGGKYLIVVDRQRSFYPPAAVAMGLPLDRMIVLHPDNDSDAMWAIDQSLRCEAVGAVLASIDQLSEINARRFQLAAEQGMTLGLFLRPMQLRRAPSWSEVQWLVQPVASNSTATNHGRQIRLQSLRMRGGRSGNQWTVNIDSAQGTLTAAPFSIQSTLSTHAKTRREYDVASNPNSNVGISNNIAAASAMRLAAELAQPTLSSTAATNKQRTRHQKAG